MGPVLLCINHPNNLIDSLLVGVILPRKGIEELERAWRDDLGGAQLAGFNPVPIEPRSNRQSR